ncbi:DUF2603 domain-containing protein [Campylobacter blaseri]|nr:DUF2603 domain-containing protein [Campylobacter blaseri]QKF85627.1 DUF2603 domain-containing protein [Campylobacter blaseri]
MLDNKYKNLDEISKILGIDADKKNVFKVQNLEDENSKLITLESGRWDSDKPLFGVDEDNNLYATISVETLKGMIKSYRKIANENFKLKLEKSIAQTFPVDFGDVWAVSLDEIKKRASKGSKEEILNIDLDEVLIDIKKRHPNLFLKLDGIIKDKIIKEVI